ncbi:hypothetical protein ACLI5Y_10125 [Enterococcus innesii]|uniref:hypothetical protein n=1 Tax=Enterococcus innesii TaxID=2839759 RepID=UPI0039851367
MNIEKFLIELRKSHQQGAFTDYVKEHWHEAVSEIENHQMSMDDVNVMIAGAKNDTDFSLYKENVVEELEG